MSKEKEMAEQVSADEKAALPSDMEVSVRPIEPAGNLLGFASVKFGGIKVDDFKIVDGKNGLFVGMPSKPDKSSKSGYRNTVSVSTDCWEDFTAKVLGAYQHAVENVQNRAANLRSTEPSIKEQLAEGTKKAAKAIARPVPVKTGKDNER